MPWHGCVLVMAIPCTLSRVIVDGFGCCTWSGVDVKVIRELSSD